MVTSKKYKYFYQEIKELGDRIRGSQPFIAHILLKNKYSLSYVNMVFRGERKNDDIVKAMKNIAKLLSESNN